MATRLRLPAFGRALPWGLAALALILAFAQRHGRTYIDTRFELTVDPGRFLDRVSSVWSPAVDLGHVQSGQFVGYLFPMGPYFAGAQALGVPPWIAERIWLAALLWLAAWGAVLLVDALYDRRRGAVHLVAGVLYLANPYVVVQANRGTASLLAYAALPWILLAAHRGMREPHAWRWPAVVALAIAASSGGTNAATVFWILVAPAALLLYEVVVLRGRRSDALGFAWRAALLTALASAWWVIPVWIQGKQGPNFLAFTEHPRTIWSTSSMSESLRLMGYWLSYFASGFGDVHATSTAGRPYLTSAPVIVATFAVPLMAVAGLLAGRRWPYASFFGLLCVGAVLVMAAGYPSGKPAASTLESIYYHVKATQFLRTTYKAGPLLSLGLSCLVGVFVRELWAARTRLKGRTAALAWAGPVALAGVVVLFAYPLFSARLIEPAFAYGSVPAAWRSGLADAVSHTRGDRRVMVLPGQLFGAYRWGQTIDPSIPPALTRHPVLQRTVGHYSDPRAAQLQEAVDDLIQQGRLVPGQLGPLLELMGVGQVLVATDGLARQTGESPPATIAEALRDQPGFQRSSSVHGASRRYEPLTGQGGPSITLPDLRRYGTPGDGGPGPVRLQAVDGSVVLDGDGNGIAQLASRAGLAATRALFYAGDLDRRAIREKVRTGAVLVFTDSNRRRKLTPSVIRGDSGPTLTAAETIPRDAAAFELFPARGTKGQTVADYGGLKRLQAPAPGRNSLAAERRPYLAFDGRIDTTWFPPEPLPGCPCLELALRRPRAVEYIRVHPRALDPEGSVRLGVSLNGGPERVVRLSGLGWNRIATGGQPLRTVRLRMIPQPLLGTPGLDEVEIPGVRVVESLRLPSWLATATRGLDLTRNAMAVELQRDTADFPFRPSASDDDADPETGMERLVTLPARRRFEISGWAGPSPRAPDTVFDRLTGVPADWSLQSSSRFEGVPSRRASSAFDGDPATAWVGDYDQQHRARLIIRSPRAFTLRRLRLVRGPSEYAFPDRVDIDAGGDVFRNLEVRSDGAVLLPRPVRTQYLSVDVTDVAAPSSAGARRQLPAVAVGEMDIPGLHPPTPRRVGSFRTPCGALAVRSRLSTATASVSGTIETLDRGAPLRLNGCGPGRSLELPAGTGRLTATGTTMRPYLLSLRSPGASDDAPPPAPGLVQSQGHGGDGERSGVHLQLRRPAWLVLGEGYARGWRASCRSTDGKERELGAPQPIDGFANGWRVGASCSVARFWFAPQRGATISYVISALAGVAILIMLLAVPLLRRRGAQARRTDTELPTWEAEDSIVRLPPEWAVALGVGLGLAGAWFFAVRAGLALAVVVAVATWVGVSSRRLLWLAMPLIAVIPLQYISAPRSGAQGFFAYANQRLASHWLAVAAVCAIAGACLLDARRLRRSLAGVRH